jgi:hypothetical protein
VIPLGMTAMQGTGWRMASLLCLAMVALGCADSESLDATGDSGADDGMPGDAAAAADAPVGVDLTSDSPPIVDAGPCKGEVSDLDRLGWIEPCPSLVDGGVPVLYCQTPGIGIFGAECGQRRTLSWDFGTHGMTCFYEQGVLVGLTMWNDTPAFCAGTSNGIEVGSIEGCPTSAETLLIDCNPFSDGGYFPYLPG